jgi:hypothetical protein
MEVGRVWPLSLCLTCQVQSDRSKVPSGGVHGDSIHFPVTLNGNGEGSCQSKRCSLEGSDGSHVCSPP